MTTDSGKGRAGIGDDLSEVVMRAKGGDRSAWDELVKRFSSLVYSIPRRYGAPDDVCEDVFQTVFASLLRELKKVEHPKALPSWLITTTHRECWRASKAGRVVIPAEFVAEHAEQEPAADSVVRWEREHKVREALRELGGQCEKLVTALFLDPGKPSYESIAARLGIPMGSIGPTRSRCLGKLAELLGELR